MYGHYGDVSTSGTRTWWDNSNAYGTNASGAYTNHATGTTGRYTASESYNYDSHLAKESYSRTANTTAGGSGSVARSETYNTETGERTYDSNGSATGSPVATSAAVIASGVATVSAAVAGGLAGSVARAVTTGHTEAPRGPRKTRE